MPNTAPPYIGLNADNDFKQHELGNAVIEALSGGLSTVSVTDRINFPSSTPGIAGQIALGTVGNVPYLKWSNDGGSTWNLVKPRDWSAQDVYSNGDVVLYNAVWYYCAATAGSTVSGLGYVPGESTVWSAMTGNVIVRYATNASQLAEALSEQTNNKPLVVVFSGRLEGDGLGTLDLSVQAPIVSLYTDESTEIRASRINIQFNATQDSNFYWHSSGTRVLYSLMVDVSSSLGYNGYLWIDRLSVAASRNIVFATSSTPATYVYYQRIDTDGGTVSGGEQRTWTIPASSGSGFVPMNLASLSPVSYDDTGRLYMDRGSSRRGYITGGTLKTQLLTACKFQIDAQGPRASIPQSGTYGQTYYATDTGNLYIMGLGDTWTGPFAFRGPTGSPGSPGQDGNPGISPTITVSDILGGHNIVIQAANQTSTVAVMDGLPGVSPVFEACNVTTLAPGSSATASVATGQGNLLTLSLGIPQGLPGSPGGPGPAGTYSFTPPLSLDSDTVSIIGLPLQPTVPINTGTVTVEPSKAYDVAGTVTALEIVGGGTEGLAGTSWMRATFVGSSPDPLVLSGDNVMIASGDTVTDGLNLFRIDFVGTNSVISIFNQSLVQTPVTP